MIRFRDDSLEEKLTMLYKPDRTDWYLSDNFDFRSGVDEQVAYNGISSVYLKSVVPRPKTYGFISKSLAPDVYFGQKLKMSGCLKTQLPEGSSAQLWLRVKGGKENAGRFDNMYKSRVRGTTEWARYEVVVDVPVDGKEILFGVLLNGTGQVWLADVTLEPAPGVAFLS